MLPPSAARFALLVSLVAASAVAVGCLANEEDASNGSARVTSGATVADLLKSTLVLDGGCIATKVGPRHLLTAARCVDGKEQFGAGKLITFQQASLVTSSERTAIDTTAADGGAVGDDAGTTAGDSDDAGAPADAGAGATQANADAGTSAKTNTSTQRARIARVVINASYTAKCHTGTACAFGAIGASDAKDIAVIVLDADLTAIKTIPVDLDAVGQSDKLTVIGSDCDAFDATPADGIHTYKTTAVPARVVNHDGSPYKDQPALVTRLGAAYVVTPGVGWRDNEPRICKTDIGAPLFRAGQSAVAGVTSNLTLFPNDKAPVTLLHTKVDSASKVGNWLQSVGVTTTHSCSEAPGGCAAKGYDGGVPTEPQSDDTTSPSGDGGVLADSDGGDTTTSEPPSGDLPSQGTATPVGGSGSDDTTGGYSEDGDFGLGDEPDAGSTKKKAAAGGCSAAPGTAGGGLEIALGLGVALAGIVGRRRRSA